VNQHHQPVDLALPLLGGEGSVDPFRPMASEEGGGERVDRSLLGQVVAQSLDALFELLRCAKAGQLKPRAGLLLDVGQVEAQHALADVVQQVDALHRAVQLDGLVVRLRVRPQP
jgi:hypothetical protein